MLKKFIVRYKWIALAVVVLVIALLVFIPSNENSSDKYAICEQGLFETSVVAVGQIEASKTIDIAIPDILRQRKVHIWGIKINDLVAEGANVKAGDYVATLDPTQVDNEIKQAQDALDRHRNSYESECLDSTIKLSAYRNDITAATDGMADKKVIVDQSLYESVAFQRQAQINYEKAIRNVEQKKRNFTKNSMRLEVEINRIKYDMEESKNYLALLTQLKSDLRILAPANGMVIYASNSWSRRKLGVGDEVSMHQPNIAVLPDLSSLVSEFFVKEVEIKHVKVGLKVRIGIDAFPDLKFSGTIIRVANIGQKITGEQMNGFKVTVAFSPYAERLLPSMTTNNTIVTGTWSDALILPRPAVFGADSLRFVYLINGMSVSKQQVLTGGENETSFQILKGVAKKDKVLLVEPSDAKEMELIRIKE